MAISVLGTKALQADFRRLAGMVTSAQARKLFREGAAIVRDQVRAEAPRGSASDGATSPGQLRRAIISFAGRRTRRGEEQSAFARVNIFKGRVRAPHGHLVEFGTADRIPRQSRFMTFKSRGQWRRAKRVRGVRPNPYFERGVSIAGPRALNHAAAGLKKLADAGGKQS